MTGPWYQTPHRAAQTVGIGERTLLEWLDSADPMPYLRVGSRRYINMEQLREYLQRKQEVR